MGGDWTPTHFTALATAIATVLTAMFSPRVVDAYRQIQELREKAWKIRRDRQDRQRLDEKEDRAIERELDEKGSRGFILLLNRENRKLAKEIGEIREHHVNCERQLGEVKGQLAFTQLQYDALLDRLGCDNEGCEAKLLAQRLKGDRD